VTFLFFLWGVPDNLNDMLIRQLKRFLCSIDFRPAAWCSPRSIWAVSCLRFPPRYSCRQSYKAGIVTGLMLFGLGTFLFWPAAIVAKHSVFHCERACVSRDGVESIHCSTRFAAIRACELNPSNPY